MILTKQISELGEAESKGKKHISKSINIIVLLGRKLVLVRKLRIDACKMDKTRKGKHVGFGSRGNPDNHYSTVSLYTHCIKIT